MRAQHVPREERDNMENLNDAEGDLVADSLDAAQQQEVHKAMYIVVSLADRDHFFSA